MVAEDDQLQALKMIPRADGITFQMPDDAYNVSISRLIEESDAHGLLLWAIFCQLRDSHNAVRLMASALVKLVEKLDDPNSRRAQADATRARIDEVFDEAVGKLRAMGIPVPPVPR